MVYQGVYPMKSHEIPLNHHFPMVFLWFSYGFPMVFLWFSYGFPHRYLQCLDLQLPCRSCRHKAQFGAAMPGASEARVEIWGFGRPSVLVTDNR